MGKSKHTVRAILRDLQSTYGGSAQNHGTKIKKTIKPFVIPRNKEKVAGRGGGVVVIAISAATPLSKRKFEWKNKSVEIFSASREGVDNNTSMDN